jgi:Tol biopolymer transport system component
MEFTGEPMPIAEHVAINAATARPLFSASQTRALLYQGSETADGWNLQWWSQQGKLIGTISEAERYLAPALSPDGKRLAVNLFIGAQGTGDIWIFDLTRGIRTRFTFGPANQSVPIWTADGKSIFYSSSAKGQPHIYAKAADGSGSERVIMETPGMVEEPLSVSPNGRYLVYRTRDLVKDTVHHVWALPLSNGGKPFPVVGSTFDELQAAVSPDGKWMTYQSNESGRREVYITAFPGGGAKWQVSSNGGMSAKWRVDGKELFFLDAADNLIAVDVNTSGNAIHLGVPHTLFQAIGIQRDWGPFDVTADGKRFLINSGNQKEGSDPFTLMLNWTAELNK